MKSTLVLTLKIEYEVDLPSFNYPKCEDDKAAAELDQEAFSSNLDELLKFIESSGSHQLDVRAKDTQFKVGSKVIVRDSWCCFKSNHINHTGIGTVIAHDDPSAFKVQMDNYDECYWRCSACTMEVKV